jgi:hypothetical protein
MLHVFISRCSLGIHRTWCIFALCTSRLQEQQEAINGVLVHCQVLLHSGNIEDESLVLDQYKFLETTNKRKTEGYCNPSLYRPKEVVIESVDQEHVLFTRARS